MLIFAISLTNAVVHPGTAFADDESEDSSIDETYKVTVAGAYLQEEARSIQGMINGFRTNKVDYENGNTPWYYDEDGKQVDDGELGVLEWDYDLEQIAIQRAIELAVVFDHTRPNGGSCLPLHRMATGHMAKTSQWAKTLPSRCLLTGVKMTATTRVKAIVATCFIRGFRLLE